MAEHDYFSEQIIHYALNTLDTADAREIEQHLKGCAQCQAELEAWRDTSSQLAYVADPVQPSADLRKRILQEARALKQRGQDTARVDPGQSASRFPIPPRLPWWRTGPGIAAIAAGLVLATALASFFVSRKLEGELRSEVASLSQRLEQQRNELERARDENELLSDPNARALMLLGTDAAPNARGKLMVDDKTGRAMLVAQNLPSAPAGKAYQLWFIADGKPLPGRTFQTDRQGRAILQDQIPEAGRKASIFAVTIEPEAGVSSPTGEKVLVGASS